jgi:Ala-tRNA(Pro) deacylase
MKLEKGRPATNEGRQEKEIRVYDFLDQLGISYDRVDHEAAYTIEACDEIDRVLDITICKNLFLCNSQKTNFYMLMMPGHKKFRTKDVSKQIESSRLSFAAEVYMEEFLDILPGSVSVMGLMNDKENKVQLLVDEDLLKDEYLGCHPCMNTTSLKIRTQDVLGTFLDAVKHKAILVHLND